MVMSGLVRFLSLHISLLAIMFISLSARLSPLFLVLLLLVAARMILLPIIRSSTGLQLLLCITLICLLAMPKKYTVQLLTFRVIDSHWKCIDPKAYSGTLADFLALLGIDYLPDSLEFARLLINDDFSVWIYNGARCVKFKLFNKPSNFLQHVQNA